jgi:hypothetical protein
MLAYLFYRGIGMDDIDRIKIGNDGGVLLMVGQFKQGYTTYFWLWDGVAMVYYAIEQLVFDQAHMVIGTVAGIIAKIASSKDNETYAIYATAGTALV